MQACLHMVMGALIRKYLSAEKECHLQNWLTSTNMSDLLLPAVEEQGSFDISPHMRSGSLNYFSVPSDLKSIPSFSPEKLDLFLTPLHRVSSSLELGKWSSLDGIGTRCLHTIISLCNSYVTDGLDQESTRCLCGISLDVFTRYCFNRQTGQRYFGLTADNVTGTSSWQPWLYLVMGLWRN